MRNAGLEETQAGIKIAGRNINNLRCADDTTLMAESEEELKSLLMKVKVESEKVGLKLNFWPRLLLQSRLTCVPLHPGQKSVRNDALHSQRNGSFCRVVRFAIRPPFPAIPLA